MHKNFGIPMGHRPGACTFECGAGGLSTAVHSAASRHGGGRPHQQARGTSESTNALLAYTGARPCTACTSHRPASGQRPHSFGRSGWSSFGRNCGLTIARVACSYANARRSRVASLNAVPTNAQPKGRPRTTPAGTLTIGSAPRRRTGAKCQKNDSRCTQRSCALQPAMLAGKEAEAVGQTRASRPFSCSSLSIPPGPPQ